MFYPDNVPSKRWLEYYAQHFDTVELNNTFYAMPKPDTCRTWAARTPEDFTFAVKLYRVITHRYRLMHSERLLRDFLAAVEALGDKLAPLLVQLPPKWSANPERLAEFLQQVPKSHRWAVEFRDARWLTDDVYNILREHNAALVLHDNLPDHPHVITADFTYMRYHGTTGEKSPGLYSQKQMAAAAREVAGLVSDGVDAYVYFNNDAHGHALTNANQLKSLLGQEATSQVKRRRAS